MYTTNIARRMILSVSLAWFGLVGACDVLDVSNPVRIEEDDLANAAGADLLRKDVLVKLVDAVGEGAVSSGLLSDEFFSNPLAAGTADESLDRRQSAEYEQLSATGNVGGTPYARWQAVRRTASVALPRLRSHMPGSSHIGHILAIRGYATLRLAEDFCPGFPLHELVDDRLVLSPALTTAEAFEKALADLNGALVNAGDSARFLNLARVGHGRALLGLGRFADASAAVSDVPSTYRYDVDYSATFPANPLHFGLSGQLHRSVADREGAAGIDFVSAGDQRLEVVEIGTAIDGTKIYRPAKYPDRHAPITLASGIEARLIEAEAKLNAGDPEWLSILNDLRANQITPALPALSDPGTEQSRLDLIFRERAFWLFGTGHRLADFRRLVEHYGRAAEAVFSTGQYWLGGDYGPATSIAFPTASESAHNSAVTGCTIR